MSKSKKTPFEKQHYAQKNTVFLIKTVEECMLLLTNQAVHSIVSLKIIEADPLLQVADCPEPF